MLLLRIIVFSLLVTGCSDNKKTSSSERGITEPTEVAGGYGLTMQCSVLNSDDSAASSSSIGCMVFNDDGSRYTGSISDGGAEIVTTSGQVIKPTQFITGATAGSYAIGVEASGLKPTDAATIRVTATFDKSRLTLVSNLKSRFSTTCTEDVTYYVNASSSASNNLCSEAQPCRTIGQAIRLLPDTINCNITVNVAAGIYKEALAIERFQVLRRGTLNINGSTTGTTELVSPGMSPGAVSVMGFTNGSTNGDSSLRIRNITITGQQTKQDLLSPNTVITRGINVVDSSILLEGVNISNYMFGTNATASSSLSVIQVKLTNVATGVRMLDYAYFGVKKELTIQGAGTDSTLAPNGRGNGLALLDGRGLGSDKSDPYQIQVSDFNVGIHIRNGSASLATAFSIKSENNFVGLKLDESFLLLRQDEELVSSEGPILWITNFKHTGIQLTNSTLADDNFLNSTAQRPTVKIESSNGGQGLIQALDRSTVSLRESVLAFCSRNASLPVPDRANASYSMVVSGGSRLVLGWDQSPFNSTCSPPSGMTFHVKTHNYRIPGVSGVCPLGYEKGPDDQCYGDFGFASHISKKLPPLNIETNFGVSADDSRLDNL